VKARRSSKTGSPSLRSAIRPARIVWVCLAALPALWFVTAPTASTILENTNPALAGTIWPWNADAQANRAVLLATVEAPPAQLERARVLAWKALAREPVNIPAVRAWALTNELLHKPGVGRLFAYAETLSRRDFVTQLWMIEALVAKGDIEGTLIHYDRALRTRKEVEPLLLPILVSAMTTPATRDPIGRLIGTRPQWWPRYMEQALTDPAAVDTLPFIFSRLRLSPGDEQSRGFLSTGIAKLIRARRYAEALQVYRGAVPPAKAAKTLLHDGSFDRDPLLPPFDWQLADGDDVSALVQAGPDGKRVLFAAPREGGRGEFARQLLVLPAGRYRLAYRTGSLPANGLGLTVKFQCVTGDQLRDMAMRQLAPAPAAGRADVLPFTVPANGCVAQWLILSIDNTGAVPESLPWIDDLRIERLPA
jgi:hypothetical protein